MRERPEQVDPEVKTNIVANAVCARETDIVTNSTSSCNDLKREMTWIIQEPGLKSLQEEERGQCIAGSLMV